MNQNDWFAPLWRLYALLSEVLALPAFMSAGEHPPHPAGCVTVIAPVELIVVAPAIAPALVMPPAVAVSDPPLMLPVAEIEVAPLTAPVRALAVMVPPAGAREPLTNRALAFVPAATLEKFTVLAVTPVSNDPSP